MKKSLVILCKVLLVFGVVASLVTASNAMAETFELREYFETLSIPYPGQSTNNLWTFHTTNHNGYLLPPGGNNYYDYRVSGSIIGDLIPAGNSAYGGCGGADSYPTFDGVFVHSGGINPTVAVFHAPQSISISEIKLWSEMIGNGLCQTPYPPANGFDVTVNSVISGVTNKIGSFIFTGPPMVEAIYTPSIILQAGDMIEILYGNNGDTRYDHGNVNVFISGLQCVPPPSGMVSWWPLDETDGAKAADIVGGNDGTYVNGPIQVAGNVAGALRFDGIDDYVDLGSNSTLNIPGSVTIDAWVKFFGFVGGWYSYFVADFDNTGWVSQLSLGVISVADNFQFLAYEGRSSLDNTHVYSLADKEEGQWYHVAVVRDDAVKTIKLYVNGNLEGSESFLGKVPASLQGNKYLGSSGPVFGDYFNGDLDEVEIYNRALSAYEIQAIYNAGSAGKCKVKEVSIDIKPAIIWVGLKNSDDQGTQFDLRAELYINDTLVSEGQTLCITGVTRNPSYAKEVTVPFGPISNGTYNPEDVLSLRVLTRIGTNPDGSKCSGPGGSHNNAVGLRLYYDSPSRPSRFGAEITPDPLMDFYLHSTSGTYFLNDVSPTGAVKYKDSSGINYNYGNLWKEIGTWRMTLD